MKSKRVQALILAAAVTGGYAGAAVYSAWAQPSVEIASDFGPGDGLRSAGRRKASRPA